MFRPLDRLRLHVLFVKCWIPDMCQAGLDGFELLVKLPASGIGGGGGRWTMAFMQPGRDTASTLGSCDLFGYLHRFE